MTTNMERALKDLEEYQKMYEEALAHWTLAIDQWSEWSKWGRAADTRRQALEKSRENLIVASFYQKRRADAAEEKITKGLQPDLEIALGLLDDRDTELTKIKEALRELLPQIGHCICGHNGKLSSADCPLHGKARAELDKLL